MGLIGDILGTIFGGSRNVVRDTVEVFRPNAEATARREAELAAASLAQFAAEFALPRKGLYDRFIDGLNRLPRPMLALGTIGLFAASMSDPVWFANRMQGIALIPEPLWWLMGAIVSFYFGARHQIKSQDFQTSLATTLARVPGVLERIEATRAADPSGAASAPQRAWHDNAALDDWAARR